MIFPANAPVSAQVNAQVESTEVVNNEDYANADGSSTAQVNAQVNTPVNLLINVLEGEMNRQEIQEKLELSHVEYFRLNYLKPALEQGLIEMTIPDKPNSRLQKYRLSAAGKQRKKSLT